MSITSCLQDLKSQLPHRAKLLAVSKGHTASDIRLLALQGQCAFGESKLQEALPKISALQDLKEIEWHFIGRLQANKVRAVVKLFDVIHSVDSLKLAERISRIAGEERKTPFVMAQVKFRPDSNKGGFLENELLDVWNNFISLPNIKVVGLMTISPISLDLEERKTIFHQCRNLADKLDLPECSMGMTRDWQEALLAGATWIRVGSGLFGKRDK